MEPKAQGATDHTQKLYDIQMKATTVNHRIKRSSATRGPEKLTLVLLLLIASLLGLNSSVAIADGPLDRPIQMDVLENDSLEESLTDWGRKSGLDVLMNTRTVSNRPAHKVKGVLSAREALRLLLRDTGLTYRQDGQRILIVPIHSVDLHGSKDSSELDKVEFETPSGAAPTAMSDGPSGSEDSSGQNTSLQGGLEQVVVTSRRREETLDTVPISITALSQKDMDEMHVENFRDLGTVVPGLTINPNNPTNQDQGSYSIRGIAGQETTQIYIDETPITIRNLTYANSISPYPYIFDLDRVEVLRGPQGTLFGAAAMGGAVRLITPQPGLTQGSGTVKADAGYTQDGDMSYEVGAAYGGPIVEDKLGFRLSAWFQQNGGWIDRIDPFTGQVEKANANTSNIYVVRPAFTWKPTDDLSITPSVFLQSRHSHGTDGYWIGNDFVNSEPRSHVWGGIAQPGTDDFQVFALNLKYKFGGLLLESDSSYLSRQFDGINDFTHAVEASINGGNPFVPGFNSFVAYDNDIATTYAWQQELRLSSQDPSSRINWVAGLFYRHAYQDLVQLEPPDIDPITEATQNGQNTVEAFGAAQYVYQGQVLNAFSHVTTTDVSEAGFGDVTLSITHSLKLDLGVRVEHLKVYNQNIFAAGPFDGGLSQSHLLDHDETPVTPRASVSYQYTDTGLLYASAAKGYRPGGGNPPGLNSQACAPSMKLLGITSVPSGYNSDSVWSYELGLKDSWLDRRVSLDTSAFLIHWSQMQNGVGLPACFETYTTNFGQAISKGFDLQLSALVTPDLMVGLTGGYTDAYYTESYSGTPQSAGQPGAIYVVAGDKIHDVIPWTASARLQYSHDLNNLWSESHAYFRTDYRWLSNSTVEDSAITGFDPPIAGYPTSPRYAVLNARIGITHRGEDISIYVNNITNSDPRLRYYHDVSGEPLYFAGMLRPRTVGATFWYHF